MCTVDGRGTARNCTHNRAARRLIRLQHLRLCSVMSKEA